MEHDRHCFVLGSNPDFAWFVLLFSVKIFSSLAFVLWTFRTAPSSLGRYIPGFIDESFPGHLFVHLRGLLGHVFIVLAHVGYIHYFIRCFTANKYLPFANSTLCVLPCLVASISMFWSCPFTLVGETRRTPLFWLLQSVLVLISCRKTAFWLMSKYDMIGAESQKSLCVWCCPPWIP